MSHGFSNAVVTPLLLASKKWALCIIGSDSFSESAGLECTMRPPNQHFQKNYPEYWEAI